MRFLLMVVLAQAAPAAAPCEDVVCVVVETAGGKVTFFADSRVDGVTIFFSVVSLNMTPASPPPIIKGLHRGRTELLTLTAIRGKKPFHEHAFFWEWGVPGATHDDTVSYRLPFGPEREFVMSQGPHGAKTHQEVFAFDFGLPRDTPVCAARGGVVVKVVDEFGDGRQEMEFVDKANLVSIVHEDGTLASYLHIERGTMRVKEGDHVEAGRVLALSGNSGYSDGPHLHLEVWRLTESGLHRTLPVKFHIDGKDHVELVEKHAYRADSRCVADMIPALEAH